MKLSVVCRTGATRVTDYDYQVTGELTPDVTGGYDYMGLFNGQPSYQLVGNGWYLWWNGIDSWMISDDRGEEGIAWWVRVDPAIEGIYFDAGTAVGIATVTAM